MSVTKKKIDESAFIIAKDNITDNVQTVVVPSNFQVGLKNAPADLTLTGKFSTSEKDYLADSSNNWTLSLEDHVTVSSISTTYSSSSRPSLAYVIINLPKNPRVGQLVIIKEFSGTASVIPLRIYDASSKMIDGANYKTISSNYGALQFFWQGANWISISSSGTSGGGTGDVIGPTSSTDNAVARFNLTTGKLIQNSGVTISDTDDITSAGNAVFGQSGLGTWSGGATYAYFSHKDAGTSEYALLQASPTGTKNTWINAPSGGKVYIGNNDTAVGYLDNNEVSLTGQSGVATTATLGNTTGTSSVTINAGTGNIDIGTSNSNRTINIGSDPTGTATSMQTINIGAKNTAGFNMLHLIDEDSSNGHEIYILSDNGTQASGTSVVEIGTVAAATTIDIGKSTVGVKDVTIGGTGGASSLILQAGTGNITMSGIVKNSSQPGFLASLSATQSNFATSSDVTVLFNSEIFDNASNFNTGTYTFTAPETGKYLFNVAVRIDNIDTAADYYTLYLITSNRNYRLAIIDPGQFAADLVYWYLNGSAIADMDASDTAYVVIRQQAGTAQTDIISATTNSFFSGWMLG